MERPRHTLATCASRSSIYRICSACRLVSYMPLAPAAAPYTRARGSLLVLWVRSLHCNTCAARDLFRTAKACGSSARLILRAARGTEEAIRRRSTRRQRARDKARKMSAVPLSRRRQAFQKHAERHAASAPRAIGEFEGRAVLALPREGASKDGERPWFSGQVVAVDGTRRQFQVLAHAAAPLRGRGASVRGATACHGQLALKDATRRLCAVVICDASGGDFLRFSLCGNQILRHVRLPDASGDTRRTG